MTSYIIRRVLACIPVLLGVTVLLFILVDLMPGDAVTAMMTPEAPTSKAQLREMRERLGLDQPWLVRYGRWLWQLLHGNLGYSYVTLQPIATLISARLGATLELMGIALIISIVLGVFLGTISAVYQYSVLDHVLTVFAFVGRSLPDFFLGLLLIYVFALRLQWLPVSGMKTPGAASLLDQLQHLVLPMCTLAYFRLAVFVRYTRSSFLEVLNSDYLVFGRAKGLRESTLIFKHAMRNALIPIITVIGLNIPVVFAGAVVTEAVFAWPGLGRLYVTAVSQRDYPLVMALSLMTAVAVLVSNLLVDLSYTFIDPRVRYD